MSTSKIRLLATSAPAVEGPSGVGLGANGDIEAALERLVELLGGRRLSVLTGAGISTESGIPDYRGPGTLGRARNPIQYQAFLSDPDARRRYWARSVLGWPRMVAARPNPAHLALVELESAGLVHGIITQNVDRLHHAAGSRGVVELHGALSEVVCLACGALEARSALQERLLSRNPGWLEAPVEYAPDGDAELPLERVRGFEVVGCLRCGGVLKPHVVFFGEAVPKDRVARGCSLLDDAEALLVIGSSLAVYSGFRFVRYARERGLCVVSINLGPTRADPLAALRVEARAGEILPRLSRALVGCAAS